VFAKEEEDKEKELSDFIKVRENSKGKVEIMMKVSTNSTTKSHGNQRFCFMTKCQIGPSLASLGGAQIGQTVSFELKAKQPAPLGAGKIDKSLPAAAFNPATAVEVIAGGKQHPLLSFGMMFFEPESNWVVKRGLVNKYFQGSWEDGQSDCDPEVSALFLQASKATAQSNLDVCFCGTTVEDFPCSGPPGFRKHLTECFDALSPELQLQEYLKWLKCKWHAKRDQTASLSRSTAAANASPLAAGKKRKGIVGQDAVNSEHKRSKELLPSLTGKKSPGEWKRLPPSDQTRTQWSTTI